MTRWVISASCDDREMRSDVDLDEQLPTLAASIGTALPNPDQILVSYLDDDPEFVIPGQFWEPFRTVGIGLSLYIEELRWSAKLPTPQSEKYALWRVGSTTIAEGSDPNATAVRMCQQIRSMASESATVEVTLFRFSRDSQFNLYLLPSTVEVLADFHVQIHAVDPAA